MELDDRSLVDILSRVGDADQLAKCSLVCRRWDRLRWAVSKLHFHLKVSDSDDLGKKELIIASVLRRTKKEAPGCLKRLSVVLRSDSRESHLKATCFWLPYAAESVTRLELELDRLEYDMSVWSSLSLFHALVNLSFSNWAYDPSAADTMDRFLPMAEESPFRSLTSCSISGAPATAELLEAVVATCPTLKKLIFSSFDDESRDAIKVVGSNIEYLVLSKGESRQGEQHVGLSLDTPRLSVLKVGIGKHPMEINFVSAENLRELVVYDSCKIQSKTEFTKLKSLTMAWDWTLDQMFAVSDLMPAVTELSIVELTSDGPVLMRLGEVCARFANLRTLHFDGYSLQCFGSDTGPFVLEALTAHVWVFMLETAFDLDTLKNLLRVNRIRMLVVHYSLGELDNKFQEWRFLCNLELLFPGRIKFKHKEGCCALLRLH